MRTTYTTQRFLDHTQQSPTRVAINFLSADGSCQSLTFGELHDRAMSMAAFLSDHTQGNRHVCLVYPPGLDFVDAFLGCLFAGAVAIPCSPPRQLGKRGANHTSARFRTLCQHAQPELILTHSSLSDRLEGLSNEAESCRILCSDSLDLRSTQRSFRPHEVRGEDLAFLQYTSGSTGVPKGVMVTHANLAANERAIQSSLQHDRDTVLVSWLPLFHDMGLVCGLLQPLFVGCQAVLMPHTSFVSAPVQWLEAITRFHGTSTGGPNFAYELCAERVSEEQKQTLDLSTLRVAFNGAEPVVAGTLERFASAFAPCGFDARAFLPCFGMAETTLMVSGGPAWRDRRVLAVDRQQLAQGQIAIKPIADQDAVELVSCGPPTTETQIIIVDPQTRQVLDANEVGEIWVRGSSVAQGYYRDVIATAEVFQATPAGSNLTYLRTGDLGFLDEQGELFVTGRIKDLMIVAGQNFYPQDIEEFVRAHLQLKRQYRIAAVGVETFGTQQIGVLVECDGSLRRLAREPSQDHHSSGLEDLAQGIRAAMILQFGVSAGPIAFLRTGSLPVTSSGKTRHHSCVELLQQASDERYYLSSGATRSSEESRSQSQLMVPRDAAFDEIRRWLSEGFLPGARQVLAASSPSTTLEDLGFDSLGTASLVAELERGWKIRVDAGEITPKATLGDLSGLLSSKTEGSFNGHPHLRTSRRLMHDPRHSDDAAVSSTPPCRVDSKVTSLTDFSERESTDLFGKTREFRLWYDDAEKRGFKRYLLPVIEHRGGRALVGGDRYSPTREVILFGSADYLGLAHDARIKAAARQAIEVSGCNVASVPLMAGSTPVHQVLEQRLASWLSTEACVLFPTGHSANMATIATLCGEQDTVVVDNRVHYSVLEGVRLAHCQWRTFGHNDPGHLATVLAGVRRANRRRGILVVLEGVYGIDGDLADLQALIAVSQEFDARVLVDDAHGIGVLGPQGEGVTTHLGNAQGADILMGSLSKAIGSFGGFIAGPRDLVDYLRFYAKAISFAVGLPTVNAAAALEGVNIITSEPIRRQRLLEKARYFRKQLIDAGFHEAAASNSTIVSLKVGSEEVLREITKELYEAGVWAEGLPFPAVARGHERLRFRIRDTHEFADLERTVELTCDVFDRHLGTRTHKSSHRSAPSGGLSWEASACLREDQAVDLYRLAVRRAQEDGFALPWLTLDFIVKYFRRMEYWSTLDSKHGWHLAYEDNKLRAAFCVDTTKVIYRHREVTAGLIGTLLSEKAHAGELAARVAEVTSDQAEDVDCFVAPSSFPVPIFGAGIQSWQTTGGKPFLETQLPESIENSLRQAGLKDNDSKVYCRIELAPNAVAPSRDHRLKTREFSRADYIREIQDVVAPVFARTIGQLDLCSPLPVEVLVGLTRDLRELAMPNFWRLAEWDGVPAGFVFCYPNLTDEFKRLDGNADVADFTHIHQSMEQASEAFVAWLAVDPAFADRGISEQLLYEIHSQLLRRGYTHTWLSWETVDGHRTTEDFARQLGHVINQATMPYFAREYPRCREDARHQHQPEHDSHPRSLLDSLPTTNDPAFEQRIDPGLRNA